ncbi:hypothetical protein [Neomicrococcus lactis]|uniref:hypothetical protein n=1 Tax=Neomicrococcus lactis TaxID=732241 RepID=UPI0016092E96|nr:hypothetical protein [Neomicrococcus lactis]
MLYIAELATIHANPASDAVTNANPASDAVTNANPASDAVTNTFNVMTVTGTFDVASFSVISSDTPRQEALTGVLQATNEPAATTQSNDFLRTFITSPNCRVDMIRPYTFETSRLLDKR